jgi:uracil-DNA glycosylase
MPTSDSRIFDSTYEVLLNHLGESEAQSYLTEIANSYRDKFLRKPDVDALAQAISACRACENVSALPVLGWWNWHDCDLLIVSSNPYFDERFIAELSANLKQSRFSSAFCGVIHATKCKFKEINDVNVSNCSSWLHDQIDVARPKVIAPLGAQAFEFFRTDQKNYTAAIGTSWWWGIYKIHCLPSSRDFLDPKWKLTFDDIYQHIYGLGFDVIEKGS